MVLTYKGYSAICDQLVCGLWIGEIVQLSGPARYITDRQMDNLEWKFHNRINHLLGCDDEHEHEHEHEKEEAIISE